MPKYLIHASLTAEGTKGVIKEGGSKRREAVEHAVKGLGGKLEAFYFAFGDDDVIVLADMPDMVSAAAIAMAVNSSGIVSQKTTVLITPEEIDQAAKKTVNYRPPGR